MTKSPYIKEEEEKEQGTFEEDVYTHEGREELLEDDEISEIEEGFSEGYEKGDTQIKCQECGKILTDQEILERKFDEQDYFFCSETCAEIYLRKKNRGR